MLQVYIDNYKCGQIFYVPKVNNYWVSCNGQKGSKVKVTLTGDFLSLAEVQVYGKHKHLLGYLSAVS